MGKEQIEEMELDEAIAHARETAETRIDLCAECRKQHQQLAEWLEELKQYRSKGYRKQSENTIVLPCALGTTLYFLYDNKYANKPDLTPRIYESNEWYFDVRNSGIYIKPLDIHCYKGTFHYELGVNVFFTREEAKMKGGGRECPQCGHFVGCEGAVGGLVCGNFKEKEAEKDCGKG